MHNLDNHYFCNHPSQLDIEDFIKKLKKKKRDDSQSKTIKKKTH